MRWITRLTVFALSVCLGTSIWLLATRLRSARTVQMTPEPSHTKAEPAKAEPVTKPMPRQEDSPAQPGIEWKLVSQFSGYANVRTMSLRDTPDAQAPVASKLKVDDYEGTEILGARDGFLHVRLDGRVGASENNLSYEGWTTWGSVVPEISAVVMDAKTGAVVARVPLNGGVDAIAYSPDGTRATFYSTQGNENSCEVRTSDFTITKCFALAGIGSYNTIFYGPTDGALYAAVVTRGDINVPKFTRLSIVRVGDQGESDVVAEIPGEPGDFAVSPDGVTGFILHGEDREKQEMLVDVVGLDTLKVRNSFTLRGTDLPTVAGTFVLNHDGTELYARLYSDGHTVSVIDTRTGAVKRVLSFNAKPKDYWYFDQGDLVGDALLSRVWNQDSDEMYSLPHVFWLGSGGHVAAEKEIYWATRAGNISYAVNARGTRLFKLDSNNRIRESLSIERPEFHKGLTSEADLSTFGLTASPDGKRLILLVGLEDGC